MLLNNQVEFFFIDIQDKSVIASEACQSRKKGMYFPYGFISF